MDENVRLEEEEYVHEDEKGSGLDATHRQRNSNSYRRNQKQKVGRGGWCSGGCCTLGYMWIGRIRYLYKIYI